MKFLAYPFALALVMFAGSAFAQQNATPKQQLQTTQTPPPQVKMNQPGAPKVQAPKATVTAPANQAPVKAKMEVKSDKIQLTPAATPAAKKTIQPAPQAPVRKAAPATPAKK